MNISNKTFLSQFPTIIEQGKIKEKITKGSSLDLFVDQVAKNVFDQPKDMNLLKIERNIYLLDEAIQGKKIFYNNSLYGKVCHFFSKIFKSPIDKAERIKNKLLSSIKFDEAKNVQQELLNPLRLNSKIINLYMHNTSNAPQSEEVLE